MRAPLEDALADHPELARAASREEAEAHLEALFLAAQGRANAYSAERLQEVYEVAERALALAAAFPPAPLEEERAKRRPAWFRRLPSLAASYGAGLLLAVTAPLVAETSFILAGICGVAAVLSLAFPGHGEERRRPKLPKPRAPEAKFEGLVFAADRSLHSMTAPRALEAPRERSAALAEEDVLALVQDVLMLSREGGGAAREDLAQNAERLARRAGYDVAWDGRGEHFEVMVDPSVTEPVLLKPALVHRREPSKTVFGVVVRGRS